IERADNGQSSDEFGNHPESEQIFRFYMPNRLFSQCLLNFQCGTAEPHHLLADAFLNNFIETHERAAANEQNLLGIDLDIFLMRMFASTLWRNIACAALQDLQQSLLHSFAGDIA